jgi:transposase
MQPQNFDIHGDGIDSYQPAESLTLQGFPNRLRHDSRWQTEGFAMGHAIPVRTDYTVGEVRRLAKRAKDAAQTRRLLAIAAVLDGASREEAATIGGMDRQTLRDWVIRFNEQGPDGLINIPSPGVPPKLNSRHKAFLARIVEEGPIPAIHGVVRWRACDLIMRLYEEFGLSVSDDTIYRALKNLGFSHMSARPKAYKQNAEAMDAFKKTSPSVWRKSARSSHPTHR